MATTCNRHRTSFAPPGWIANAASGPIGAVAAYAYARRCLASDQPLAARI
jgi:hypothetical protein